MKKALFIFLCGNVWMVVSGCKHQDTTPETYRAELSGTFLGKKVNYTENDTIVSKTSYVTFGEPNIPASYSNLLRSQNLPSSDLR